MPSNRIPAFQDLTGMYEPSAIQQLADERFLVVEDEKDHPFSLVTLHPNGTVSSTPLRMPMPTRADDFHILDDLEGTTIDRLGNLYAITSHSRDGDGDEKKSRNKLVRFRIEHDRIMAPQVVDNLQPALCDAHPVLASAAAVRDVKNDNGFNIEALALSPDSQQLWIGFRSPLHQQRAIIASVDNYAAMFDAGAPPAIASALITLDLDGHGIRGMSALPQPNGYLVISGPSSRETVQFGLWFWSGRPQDPAQRVQVDGLPGFEHAEGICPAMLDGQPRIMIVSDDGSRKKNRFARYLLLDPAQLRIEA